MLKRFKKQVTIVVVALFAAPTAFGDTLEFRSQQSIRLPDPSFGGYSSLHISKAGTHLLATSDRGTFLSAEILRQEGDIGEIRDLKISPIRQINGSAVKAENSDAEGLAVDENGNIYISFEGFHRVRKHNSINDNAQAIVPHPVFKNLQNNSGLEALAIDHENRLYAIPERSGKLDRPFPIYRYSNGKWSKFGGVPRDGDYLIVGADIGPDDRLYVLERAFGGITFTSRIRSYAIGTKGIEDMRELLVTPKGKFDNLEGISVWKAPNGKTRVTLISDDNFLFLLGTDLVEFELKP